MKAPFRILHACRRGPGEVRVRWTASSRRGDAELEAHLDAAWARAVARPGVRLFDGPMCRLESWREEGGILTLEASRTSYRVFLGTQLDPPERRLDDDELARSIGVSCALRSADGWLMFGRRGGSVAYHAHRIHPFAGALEPRDSVDVFDEARRELAEETALPADAVASMLCLGLAQDVALRQPELLMAAWTTWTRARIESAVDDAEHQGAFAVADEPGAIAAAGAEPLLTPIARACLARWRDA